VAVVRGTELTVANVGDSRGVLCDVDGKSHPLSYDHKPHEVSLCDHLFYSVLPPFLLAILFIAHNVEILLLTTFESRLKTYFLCLVFDCSIHVWLHHIPASSREVTTS